MKREDYKKDGMEVLFREKKFVANDVELCGDGTYVVHLVVPGRDAQLRVPIARVEEKK